jgi:hypothetical protein
MSAWRTLALGALALVGGCSGGGGSQIPGVPTGEALAGLTLFGGWRPARALPAPIHSDGWEDSSFISADGRTLYFGYTQKNATIWLQQAVAVYDGAPRPGAKSAMWNIYEAEVRDGGWTVVDSTANFDDPNASQAAQGVDPANLTMVMARLGSVGGDIYRTTRADGGAWVVPARLDEPISTGCVEDNPTLSEDGTRLYFESNRDDAAGSVCRASKDARDIWVSTFADGAWSLPSPVAGAPNRGDAHSQPFSRDATGELWWTGHDARCGGAYACLYRAVRQPDGSFADDTLVALPTAVAEAQLGDVLAVGEASLTGDGRLLYFTYATKTAAGLDFDIGVAYRP